QPGPDHDRLHRAGGHRRGLTRVADLQLDLRGRARAVRADLRPEPARAALREALPGGVRVTALSTPARTTADVARALAAPRARDVRERLVQLLLLAATLVALLVLATLLWDVLS